MQGSERSVVAALASAHRLQHALNYNNSMRAMHGRPAGPRADLMHTSSLCGDRPRVQSNRCPQAARHVTHASLMLLMRARRTWRWSRAAATVGRDPVYAQLTRALAYRKKRVCCACYTMWYRRSGPARPRVVAPALEVPPLPRLGARPARFRGADGATRAAAHSLVGNMRDCHETCMRHVAGVPGAVKAAAGAGSMYALILGRTAPNLCARPTCQPPC